jgi:hypothetical protein
VSVAQHRRFRDRLQKQIARRSAAGNSGVITTGLLSRETERYMTSHAVQSSVLYDLWLRKHGLPEAQRLWASAQQTPVCPYSYRRLRPPVIAFFHKARSTEGVRKICRFADIEKMWHVIARDLIVAQHQPRPHIGDWVGRGRDWQIDQIRAALTSSRQGVVCADITRAFASVNIDAAYELPYLPEPLIRRAIDYRSHRFVCRERSEYARDVYLAVRNDGDLERSPSGLMEGSPASNAIFSVLMNDLPDRIGNGIRAFVYCDNIILIAPTMSRALQAREALVQYLIGHRAGPFGIRSHVCTVGDSFEHLGYSLWKRGAREADIGLSTSGWLKLVDRLYGTNRDSEEIATWLKASYGRCSGRSLASFLLFVRDGIGG